MKAVILAGGEGKRLRPLTDHTPKPMVPLFSEPVLFYLLSQLEKGSGNPTINTILKIANALKVPYTALLDTLGSSAAVVRGSDLPVQASEDGRYRARCYYASTAERNFEWFQLYLEPGCRYTSIGHRARALEYLVVQSGKMAVEVGGRRYELGQDDAISFHSSQEHCYINTGTGTTALA